MSRCPGLRQACAPTSAAAGRQYCQHAAPVLLPRPQTKGDDPRARTGGVAFRTRQCRISGTLPDNPSRRLAGPGAGTAIKGCTPPGSVADAASTTRGQADPEGADGLPRDGGSVGRIPAVVVGIPGAVFGFAQKRCARAVGRDCSKPGNGHRGCLPTAADCQIRSRRFPQGSQTVPRLVTSGRWVRPVGSTDPQPWSRFRYPWQPTAG